MTSRIQPNLKGPSAIPMSHGQNICYVHRENPVWGSPVRAASRKQHLMFYALSWNEQDILDLCAAGKYTSLKHIILPAPVTSHRAGTGHMPLLLHSTRMPVFPAFPPQNRNGSELQKAILQDKTCIAHLCLQELSRLCQLLSWKYYMFRYIKISICRTRAQKKQGTFIYSYKNVHVSIRTHFSDVNDLII